jgi:hypothetical protein
MGKRLIQLFIIILTLTVAVFDVNAISGGYPGYWLNYGVGARVLAMGQSFVAISDDVNAIYWNPAGIVQVERVSLSVMHTDLFYDTRYDFIGFVVPFNKYSFGIGALQLFINDAIRRDENNVPGGYFEVSKECVFFANSFEISKNILLGFNIKSLSERYNGNINSGTGLDFGLLYKFNEILSMGMNTQNIIRPQLNDVALPVTINTGLNLKLLKKSLNMNIEVSKMELVNKADCKLGLEYWILGSFFAVRAGISSEPESFPSMGIGMKFNNFGFDYSILNHNTLGASHRASLNFIFGKTKEEKALEKQDTINQPAMNKKKHFRIDFQIAKTYGASYGILENNDFLGGVNLFSFEYINNNDFGIQFNLLTGYWYYNVYKNNECYALYELPVIIKYHYNNADKNLVSPYFGFGVCPQLYRYNNYLERLSKGINKPILSPVVNLGLDLLPGDKTHMVLDYKYFIGPQVYTFDTSIHAISIGFCVNW